jgi:hypothetical protein
MKFFLKIKKFIIFISGKKIEKGIKIHILYRGKKRVVEKLTRPLFGDLKIRDFFTLIKPNNNFKLKNLDQDILFLFIFID